MKSLIYPVLLGLLFSFTPGINAQIEEDLYNRIDSIFIDWNQPNHPGGAIGIMQNGKMIFSKAYGLASLEYLVPNTPDTKFNIASVSKQFTGMGIVVLSLQGKLSLNDDVRKYLPELPDFGDTITIRHLLHHTSGMRSLHALLGLAGWRDDDLRTNQDLFRFMKNQKELNFKPGDEFLYCNTGYMLMADIIEKVTEEKFACWMKGNIFEPLGMIHTYVEDDYRRVVPANATSYHGSIQSGFSRAIEFWGYVGSGNMHSNTHDLLLWMNNYYHPESGWENAFELMQTLGVLNSNDTLDYAFGIRIDEYRDKKRLQHGGSIGGYRAFVQAFPEEGVNTAILTNFSSSDVNTRSAKISDLLLQLETESEGNEIIQESAVNSVYLSEAELKSFNGSYWNEKGRYSRKIYLKDDTLRYYRSENSESKLLPVDANRFQMLDVESVVMVTFNAEPSDSPSMTVQIEDEDPLSFEFYRPPAITKELLNSYKGKYFSQELDTQYSIWVKGDSLLMGNHSRHGDFEIEILQLNDLMGKLVVFQEVKVKRNKRDKITGLYVTNGRVRNLWFEKL